MGEHTKALWRGQVLIASGSNGENEGRTTKTLKGRLGGGKRRPNRERKKKQFYSPKIEGTKPEPKSARKLWSRGGKGE